MKLNAGRRLLWWMIHHGPRRDVTVDTFNGRMTFSSRQWLIGKYLYVFREHAQHEILAAVDLLQSIGYSSAGKTLINVGANIGMTSVAAVRNGVADRVIAFEPAPDNFPYLVKNVEQNGLADRVWSYQLALSSRPGMVEFELSPSNSGDHRVRLTAEPGIYKEESRRTVQVQATSLDAFMAETPAVRELDIALVWVDIQGHERHFFEGAREFFRGRRIPAIAELWPYGLNRAGTTRADYVAVLAESFGEFCLISDPPVAREPIDKLDRLFDEFSGPRQFCDVLLLPR